MPSIGLMALPRSPLHSAIEDAAEEQEAVDTTLLPPS